jgi:DNA-binding beta-propeller fold protein YncE
LKNRGFLLLLIAIFILTIFTSPLALAANYNLIKKWGSLGNSPSQFNEPSDVTLDPVSNAVYVSDLQNNRIQKFDSNGNYITTWGSAGTGPGQFQHPGDIAVDNETRFVYVSDIVNSRIQKFDDNGSYVSEWGAFGRAMVSLTIPEI